MMELLICYCQTCDSELARCRNSWDAIGSTYHSPVHPPLHTKGLKTTGAAYGAAPGSTIEHSSLYDVACFKCRTVLGLQCYSAPPGHLLKRDQFILNLNLMFVVSQDTGHDATLSVLKTIPLVKGSGKRTSTTGTSRSSTAQPDAQRSSHQKSAPPRPNIPTANGVTSRPRPPVPSFNSTVPKTSALRPPVPAVNISNSKTLSTLQNGLQNGNRTSTATSSSDVADEFKSRAEEAIRNQQRDIDRVSGTVERIERDMQSFRDFMRDIRTELASSRDLRARELEELEKMRQRIEDNEQRPRSSGSNGISARSLEALTEDILHVNEKANEVDEVRAEMEKLQGRLKELEELANARSIASAPEPRPQTILASPSAKRRHEQINELSTPVNESLSPPKNPNKRRRFSHRLPGDGNTAGEEPDQGSTVNFGTPEMIGLEPEGPDMLTGDGNDHDIDNQFAIEDKEPTPDPEPQLLPRRRSTRIEVRIPGHPRMSLPQRQLEEVTTSDAVKRRRKSDVNYSRRRTSLRRNSDGLIVASNGKIDGRSLRYKKHLADIGYQTPQAQISQASATGPRRVRSSVIAQEVEVMPSVELDDSVTPARPAAISPNLSTPHTADKDYKCGSCGKSYSTPQALEYHHEHTAACADRSKDQAPKYLKDGKPFRCGTCKKGYASINALDYHHKHSSCVPSESSPDILPTCPSCNQSYTVLFRLEKHIEIGACRLPNYDIRADTMDLNSPLLTCNACGNPFKSRLEMEGHKCSRVKLHSLNFREASLAAREVALVERERSVRMTLERELGDLQRGRAGW